MSDTIRDEILAHATNGVNHEQVHGYGIRGVSRIRFRPDLVEVIPRVLGEEGADVPGVALELTVHERTIPQRPEIPHAVVRLPEYAQAEHSHCEEQHGRADERDEQLGVDLGRQAADGSDERILSAAQRPPILNGCCPFSLGSPSLRHGSVRGRTQGARVVDPATMFVISHRPSIRATSWSATVTSATSWVR